ncbi:DNA repair protein RAD50 [Exophiala viscosa]|uniref:DNA repair protein RAD50 n=1 Tax=Exophiala viscosa TaxID=2486360 RepID=A0AAN6IDY9_9EURO|nr:DNA repair protein RAD50 [Exophiala viscosa]KAI1621493.1 DNA repair protein RAD50 [Exophiala viscosa]
MATQTAGVLPTQGTETPQQPLPQSQNTPSSVSISSEKQNDTNEPPEFNVSTRFLMAFAALSVLTLMVALDGTSISVALPIIAKKLHGSAIEAFWAGTSFLLASTVFQPNFASFSHIFGRMPVIMVSITLFFVGVMMAALSNNFGLLLAGRSVQGIGGGGIIAMTEIVVTDLVPLRWRGQWAGVIAGMWSIGSVSGPIIGGAFADVQWRWIFWLNLPFIGIGGVMVPLFLRLNVIPQSIAAKLRRVDWIGSVLFVGSMTSFLIPLTWGGVMYSWSSWRTLVPLLVGALGLVGFCFFEAYVAAEPLLRLSVFSNRSANIAYATTTLHGMILWCILYYQPLYFEAVKGYSPVVSGVALFPATFTVAPMAVVTGLMITKTAAYRWSVWLGWCVSVLGLGLLILLDVDTSVPQWIFIDLVSGLGLGILFPSLQFALQAASTAKDMAFAVAMFVFFRSFGQALGVAIGGVIFQNQMVKNLQAYPTYASQASELAKDAAALVEIIKNTASGQGKLELKTAYTDSLRTVYIVLTALAAVCLVASLFIKSYDLNVGLETEQGLIQGSKVKEVKVEEGDGAQ